MIDTDADRSDLLLMGRAYRLTMRMARYQVRYPRVPKSSAVVALTQNPAARIAELERLLSKERATVQALQREREENLLLIEDWESAAGKMVAQIRDYCQNNQMSYLAQKRHYNELLQAERDSHLESRIDRDHWYEQSLRYAAMIRQAYQLRCEEDDLPTHVIEGLQNEVRAYRTALGMETQKPEEEFGWQYLKDVPRWPGSPNKKES